MKKLILFSIMCLLLLTLVSAFEFDNVGKYDEGTQTITIKNSILGISWLDLDTVAEIQLTSPLSVALPLGYYNFANITVKGFEDYTNFLNSIDFYDRKISETKFDNENKFGRDFDIKIREIEEYSVDDYGNTDFKAKNGSTIKRYQIIGSHIKERTVWRELTEKDIKQGETLNLELFTIVENADNVEWIPNFMGVRIDEWAEFNATGGTITFDGDFQIHTFTTNGTFTVTGTGFADVLVVAGGGAGGQQGGGGGAGGYTYFQNFTLTAQAYAVIVGVGGDGVANRDFAGENGSVSVFDNLTMIGGGGGAGWGFTGGGIDGGSGGGGANGPPNSRIGGLGTAGQGNNGGDSHDTIVRANGGGGGAGEIGTNGSNNNGGDGGDGLNNSINGTSTFYAGGGGGTVLDANGVLGVGGLGGGGTGGDNNDLPTNATDGTGGGGGGGDTGDIGANGGDGIVIIRFLPTVGAPSVTLNAPTNNTNLTTNDVSMNCTVFDLDGTIINVSLILDGVLNETNSSGLNNSLYNFDKIVSVDNHNWTCRAVDNDSDITIASPFFFGVNISLGTELVSPADEANITTTITTFLFNSTPINQDLVSANITVWFSNGTFFFSNSTPLSGSVEVQTQIGLPLSDENYIWTADTIGVITTNSTINRTFTVHTTPATVTITFPTGNIDSLTLGDNLSLNWSITEPGQNLSTHIVNCSFTYNSVEIFLNLTQCIEINSTTFLYVNGVNNLSMKVQDEFNFNTTNTTSWTFSVIENEIFFTNPTIEGVTETYTVNVTLGSGEVISSSNFSYNGTGNSVTITDIGNNMFNLTSELTVPSVGADTNLSFFWQINLASSSQVNTSINNQTVQNIAIDNCTANTNVIFNYTMLDEEVQTQLSNTTFEIDINLFNLDKTVSVLNFSVSVNNTNPVAICLNISLTNQTVYALDSVVKYSSIINYAIEYYNIQNFTLRNSTVPQNINLFELLTVDSTEFQITFKDASFVVVENALVQINRQYVAEGVFKTVEIPRTDSNGQTVGHFVEKDVVYNIIVTKEGIILGTFNNVIAFCDDAAVGQCFIALNALESNIPAFDYDAEIGLSFDFTYNRTSRVLQFPFTTTDGSVKNVSMNGTRLDSLGNTSICGDFLVSASGTLTCTIPIAVGNETIIINVFVDGDLKIQNYIQAGVEFDLGDAGYFLLFFLVLSFALMLSQSKIGVIVGTVLGFIAGILLFLFRGGLVGVGSSIVWLVLWAIALIWKLNSERQT